MLVKWDPTYRCNLNCKHCGVPELRGQPYIDDNEVKGNDFLKTVEKVLKSSRTIQSIQFLGGEPLLKTEIFDALRLIKEKQDRIKTYIVTNGTLLNKNIASKIIPYLDGIVFSIDGPRELHNFIRGDGVYEKVEQAIKIVHDTLKTLKKEDFTLAANVLIGRFNIRRLDQLIKALARLNITHIMLITPGYFGNAKKHWDVLDLQKEDAKIVLKGLRNVIRVVEVVNYWRLMRGEKPVIVTFAGFPLIVQYYLYLTAVRRYEYFQLELPGKVRRCPAIQDNKVYIAPNSSVWPCDMVPSVVNYIAKELLIEIRPPKLVEKQTLDDALKDKFYVTMVQHIAKSYEYKLKASPCSRCPYIDYCSACPLYLKYIGAPIGTLCEYLLDTISEWLNSKSI